MNDDALDEPRPWICERARVACTRPPMAPRVNTLEDRPINVLSHLGAKSGLLRKSPLMRIEHEGSCAVIASTGGTVRDRLLANNIAVYADVRVQDGPTTFALNARRVFGEEQEQWWPRGYQTFPKFEQYRHAAGRDVPLCALEPA